MNLTSLVHRIRQDQGFILRGGLLTQAWVAPDLARPTTDLDFVGDYAFDVDETRRRIEACGIVVETARPMWEDSGFPGVKIACEGITIDVGFNDPLVPPPTTVEIEGQTVRCVRPETQVAWKLHALAENGASFRPKDLADLWRITSRIELDHALLEPAIVAAFESRGFSLDQATSILEHAWWETKTSRVRWMPGRTGAGVPPLPRALREVRSRLEPTLSRMRG